MQDTRLGTEADRLAPDGSQIRFLLSGEGGALNHFTLPPGAASTAVAHKTIEELWYFLSGTGQLWRRRGEHEVIVDVGPGVCLMRCALVGHSYRGPLPVPQHWRRAAARSQALIVLQSAEVAEFAKGLSARSACSEVRARAASA